MLSGHDIQLSLPTVALYVPASQSVHDPGSPVCPGGQPSWQSLEEVLPSIDDLPSGQSLHAADPDTSLYLPASHAAHAPPSGPVYPTLHVQATTAVLAAGEPESAGQSLHVDEESAEYLPAEQSLQLISPEILLYLPAAQPSHDSPSWSFVKPGDFLQVSSRKRSQHASLTWSPPTCVADA